MKVNHDMHLNEISDDQLECITGCGDIDELVSKFNISFGIPSDIIDAYNNNQDTESDANL